MQGTGPLVRFNIIFFFLFFSISLAQNFSNFAVDQLLRSGIDKILRQDYDGAEREFLILDQKFPSLPIGKIYLAALEITKSFDYMENYDDKNIVFLLKRAEEISDSLLDKNDSDLWNNYYMALSLGFYAYFEVMHGNYFSAFGNGFSSLKYLERCLKIDSLFHESKIGLGTYIYWKSIKTKPFHWLPFLSDESRLGLRLLESAVENSTYNHYLAINSLIWIYIEEKEYELAVSTSKKILNFYPENRITKWALASAYLRIDKKKAIDTYYEIWDSLKDTKLPNRYNEITLKHKIAMLYDELGEYKNALDLCLQILKIKDLPDEVPDSILERIRRVKTLKEKILDIISRD